jgi:S-(hydroxymethyl)glutathione dehydrogenase/alcohol dehydrogenase
MVGVPAAEARASFAVAGMYLDKSILGLRYGSSRPHLDIPTYVELYRRGDLLLDELVTATMPLDEIDHAIHELETGTVARSVLLI